MTVPLDPALAARTNVPVRVIAAIGKVESGGNPAAVRLEPHIFWRIVLGLPSSYTGQQIHDALTPAQLAQVPYTPGPTGAASHVAAETNAAAVTRAANVNANAAVRATSWGMYQDLGSSLLSIAGPDPRTAMAAFWANPMAISGRLFEEWVRAHPAFPAKARSLDFNAIAAAYNGCHDCTLYSSKLRAAYNATAGAAGIVGGAVALLAAWGLWKWLA